ncbi:MAG: hypothetical protein LRY40_01005, partial [Shewanella fodinae]|nr:hypothetical protein [Shewanella fodinae]
QPALLERYSGFDDAACGVSQAANDLGYSASDVETAFAGVDVDASCNTTPPPATTGELLNGQPISGITGRVALNNAGPLPYLLGCKQ